jgi:hypothetical protein
MMAPPISRGSSRGPAGTEAAAKETYRRELVVERITKQAVNHFTSRAMMEGAEREPYARMLYEADTQQVVDTVGFALHYEWDWFGASADGLCGESGGVELKAPTEMVHDSYLSDPMAMVEEYKWQVLGNLTCFPERTWWDLASFNPHFPDALKLVKFRFHRSDCQSTIALIEEEAQKFHTEIEAAVAQRGLPPTVFDIMPQDEQPAAEYDPSRDFASNCDFISDEMPTP